MKTTLCGMAAIVALVIAVAGGRFSSAQEKQDKSTLHGQSNGDSSPIYGVKIPAGYRDWKLISVGHVAGSNNDLRAKLGNDIAIKAYREGTLPFPDGAIIARLAWHEVTSDENNKALGDTDSSVAGSATNLEFMVKDSKKYASTGGWGFAQFTDGKPDSEALHKTCFPCHAPAKDNDFVFTRYAR
jgi:hypothetical protein